jgi:hypothetical protein
MDYTQFNQYNALLKYYSFSEEESKQVIEDMLTRYNIDKAIFHDYNNIKFTNDNILNYISCNVFTDKEFCSPNTVYEIEYDELKKNFDVDKYKCEPNKKVVLEPLFKTEPLIYQPYKKDK